MRKPGLALLLSVCLAARAATPEWHPIQWYVDSFAGGPKERLALFLPAVIDGVPCLVQLDTGANGELLWRGQAGANENPPKRLISVELAGIRKQVWADEKNLAYLTPEVCRQRAIATVGNAFFEDGTLTLDLRNNRFAFTRQALLAHEHGAQPLLYLRWAQSGGHTVVEVEPAGHAPAYALLDTGAARFGLAATDAGEWAALTGGAPLAASDKVRQYSLDSWGKQVQCFETDVQRQLTVGATVVEQGRASYCVGQGFKSPVKLIGVLGLHPLRDKVITLDYLSRRWTLRAN
ncbi:MAG TPA: hypothetical protein VF616_23980 [Duganella sp.]|uniref:hypothetical protein n=1 Tax=Duganella sp. TaxID=1904440 RepID=UPI002ED51053